MNEETFLNIPQSSKEELGNTGIKQTPNDKQDIPSDDGRLRHVTHPVIVVKELARPLLLS